MTTDQWINQLNICILPSYLILILEHWIWSWAMWTMGCGKRETISRDAPMFLLECVFFVRAVDCGEAKGWLRSRNLSADPEAQAHGERMKVCLRPPGSRSMHANDTRLCSAGPAVRASENARAPLCCACASLKRVFVLFSVLSDMWLTDSIQSADRARCVTI